MIHLKEKIYFIQVWTLPDFFFFSTWHLKCTLLKKCFKKLVFQHKAKEKIASNGMEKGKNWELWMCCSDRLLQLTGISILYEACCLRLVLAGSLLKSRKFLPCIPGQMLSPVQYVQNTEGCLSLWLALYFGKICCFHFYKHFHHSYN